MTVAKRNDANTFRSMVRVPKDLLEVYKKPHVYKTLGKVSYREAVVADRIFAGEMEIEFAFKRRERSGESLLSPIEARKYARDLVRSYLEDMDEQEELDMQAYQDIQSSFHHYIPDIIKQIPIRYSRLNVNDIAKVQSVIEDEFSAELLELMNAGAPPAFIAPAPPPVEAPTPWDQPKLQDSNYNLGPQGTITLEKAVELYKGSEKWAKYPAKTKLNYQRTFPVLFALFGKKRLMHTISPEDICWLRKMIDNLPMGFTGKQGAKEIITGIKAREDKLPKAPEVIGSLTKNKHHGVIKAIFQILTKSWYLKVNVADGLERWSGTDNKWDRVAYSRDELKSIITKASANPTTSEMYWIPLIAAYTGARRGELCQLSPADIVQHEGVWSFLIRGNETKDQSLKNPYSHRIVPIHSTILNAGFLSFFNENQKNENGRIWEGLHKNLHGWGDAFGKRFAKMTLGLSKTTGIEMKDFHSIRHNVTGALIDKVDFGILDSLLGWSSDERAVLERNNARNTHTRDGYSKERKPVQDLKEAIELLNWGTSTLDAPLPITR